MGTPVSPVSVPWIRLLPGPGKGNLQPNLKKSEIDPEPRLERDDQWDSV
jgi:hypothetical protein